MRVRDPQLAAQAAGIALSSEIPPQADVLRLGLVLALAGEHPQLAWATFTGQLDLLTAANPGNRPNVLAKTAPEVFWAGIPGATLQSWIKDRIEPGMADTLADSMRTARFRQDEKTRLVEAADRIVARRP
jgi:aminopeptidase N